MRKKLIFCFFLNQPRIVNFLMLCLVGAVAVSCRCSNPTQPEVKKDQEEESTTKLPIAPSQPVHYSEVETSPQEEEQLAMADKPDLQTTTEAYSVINPLKDSQLKGIVTFTKVIEGTRIIADVEGLTPGEHGFHVHEHGSCEGDGTSAGGHFNPTNSQHGGPNSPERHVGDLGNLIADENGKAHYDRVDTVISLEGENSIIGRSLVIHADRDDFTSQPTGNSGPRIGCGLILKK